MIRSGGSLTVGALVLLATSAVAAEGPRVAMRFVDARGQDVRLDEPGKVYLLDFWALGCKPCIDEAPELARLQRDLGADGRFAVVAPIYGGWKPDSLADVAARGRMEGLLVVSDPEGWFVRLGIDGFPTKLLVRDGRILERVMGGGQGAYEHWHRKVRDALARREAGPAVSPPGHPR